jgi:hypothetical protein
MRWKSVQALVQMPVPEQAYTRLPKNLQRATTEIQPHPLKVVQLGNCMRCCELLSNGPHEIQERQLGALCEQWFFQTQVEAWWPAEIFFAEGIV